MDAHATQHINFEDRITRLALQVAEKIVLEGGMLELSQRTPERAKNAKEMYFHSINGEIFLYLYSCPGMVKYGAQVSLLNACHNIIAEIDRIFDDENAERLFELSSFDREEVYCGRHTVSRETMLRICRLFFFIVTTRHFRKRLLAMFEELSDP